MQKNIVFGVNKALAAEAPAKAKTSTVSATGNETFAEIKKELDQLRQENQDFAKAMQEIKTQNEKLQGKIEQLMFNSKNSSKKKTNKKKK
jgi:hypothetical protein